MPLCMKTLGAGADGPLGAAGAMLSLVVIGGQGYIKAKTVQNAEMRRRNLNCALRGCFVLLRAFVSLVVSDSHRRAIALDAPDRAQEWKM
jgi:hypothetical protein